jgi:hypothetical protein
LEIEKKNLKKRMTFKNKRNLFEFGREGSENMTPFKGEGNFL